MLSWTLVQPLEELAGVPPSSTGWGQPFAPVGWRWKVTGNRTRNGYYRDVVWTFPGLPSKRSYKELYDHFKEQHSEWGDEKVVDFVHSEFPHIPSMAPARPPHRKHLTGQGSTHGIKEDTRHRKRHSVVREGQHEPEARPPLSKLISIAQDDSGNGALKRDADNGTPKRDATARPGSPVTASCQGFTVRGARCQRRPANGSPYCEKHGVDSAQKPTAEQGDAVAGNAGNNSMVGGSVGNNSTKSVAALRDFANGSVAVEGSEAEGSKIKGEVDSVVRGEHNVSGENCEADSRGAHARTSCVTGRTHGAKPVHKDGVEGSDRDEEVEVKVEGRSGEPKESESKKTQGGGGELKAAERRKSEMCAADGEEEGDEEVEEGDEAEAEDEKDEDYKVEKDAKGGGLKVGSKADSGSGAPFRRFAPLPGRRDGSVLCEGVTITGARCSSSARLGLRYCVRHAATEGVEVEGVRYCQGRTVHDNQCSHKALDDSEFCAKHGGREKQYRHGSSSGSGGERAAQLIPQGSLGQRGAQPSAPRPGDQPSTEAVLSTRPSLTSAASTASLGARSPSGALKRRRADLDALLPAWPRLSSLRMGHAVSKDEATGERRLGLRARRPPALDVGALDDGEVEGWVGRRKMDKAWRAEGDRGAVSGKAEKAPLADEGGGRTVSGDGGALDANGGRTPSGDRGGRAVSGERKLPGRARGARGKPSLRGEPSSSSISGGTTHEEAHGDQVMSPVRRGRGRLDGMPSPRGGGEKTAPGRGEESPRGKRQKSLLGDGSQKSPQGDRGALPARLGRGVNRTGVGHRGSRSSEWLQGKGHAEVAVPEAGRWDYERWGSGGLGSDDGMDGEDGDEEERSCDEDDEGGGEGRGIGDDEGRSSGEESDDEERSSLCRRGEVWARDRPEKGRSDSLSGVERWRQPEEERRRSQSPGVKDAWSYHVAGSGAEVGRSNAWGRVVQGRRLEKKLSLPTSHAVEVLASMALSRGSEREALGDEVAQREHGDVGGGPGGAALGPSDVADDHGYWGGDLKAPLWGGDSKTPTSGCTVVKCQKDVLGEEGEKLAKRTELMAERGASDKEVRGGEEKRRGEMGKRDAALRGGEEKVWVQTQAEEEMGGVEMEECKEERITKGGECELERSCLDLNEVCGRGAEWTQTDDVVGKLQEWQTRRVDQWQVEQEARCSVKVSTASTKLGRLENRAATLRQELAEVEARAAEVGDEVRHWLDQRTRAGAAARALGRELDCLGPIRKLVDAKPGLEAEEVRLKELNDTWLGLVKQSNGGTGMQTVSAEVSIGTRVEEAPTSGALTVEGEAPRPLSPATPVQVEGEVLERQRCVLHELEAQVNKVEGLRTALSEAAAVAQCEISKIVRQRGVEQYGCEERLGVEEVEDGSEHPWTGDQPGGKQGSLEHHQVGEQGHCEYQWRGEPVVLEQGRGRDDRELGRPGRHDGGVEAQGGSEERMVDKVHRGLGQTVHGPSQWSVIREQDLGLGEEQPTQEEHQNLEGGHLAGQADCRLRQADHELEKSEQTAECGGVHSPGGRQLEGGESGARLGCEAAGRWLDLELELGSEVIEDGALSVKGQNQLAVRGQAFGGNLRKAGVSLRSARTQGGELEGASGSSCGRPRAPKEFGVEAGWLALAPKGGSLLPGGLKEGRGRALAEERAFGRAVIEDGMVGASDVDVKLMSRASGELSRGLVVTGQGAEPDQKIDGCLSGNIAGRTSFSGHEDDRALVAVQQGNTAAARGRAPGTEGGVGTGDGVAGAGTRDDVTRGAVGDGALAAGAARVDHNAGGSGLLTTADFNAGGGTGASGSVLGAVLKGRGLVGKQDHQQSLAPSAGKEDEEGAAAALVAVWGAAAQGKGGVAKGAAAPTAVAAAEGGRADSFSVARSSVTALTQGVDGPLPNYGWEGRGGRGDEQGSVIEHGGVVRRLGSAVGRERSGSAVEQERSGRGAEQELQSMPGVWHSWALEEAHGSEQRREVWASPGLGSWQGRQVSRGGPGRCPASIASHQVAWLLQSCHMSK